MQNNFQASKVKHIAPFFFFEEVTSTNDVIAQKAKEGASHLTAVMADKQTKGRGRLGRQWVTYPACALAFSMLIRKEVGLLPIIAIVALHKAVSQLFSLEAAKKISIKWPNDLLIDGAKAAGILIESYPNINGQGRFYVVGIGVNVLEPPHGYEYPNSISLEALGTPPKREAILSEILQALSQTLDETLSKGYANLLSTYKKYCATFGQNIIWREGQTEISGQAIGMNEEGHLLLQTQEGTIYACAVGDVIAQK